jgi:hypothetical protein
VCLPSAAGLCLGAKEDDQHYSHADIEHRIDEMEAEGSAWHVGEKCADDDGTDADQNCRADDGEDPLVHDAHHDAMPVLHVFAVLLHLFGNHSFSLGK